MAFRTAIEQEVGVETALEVFPSGTDSRSTGFIWACFTRWMPYDGCIFKLLLSSPIFLLLADTSGRKVCRASAFPLCVILQYYYTIITSKSENRCRIVCTAYVRFISERALIEGIRVYEKVLPVLANLHPMKDCLDLPTE